MPRTKDPIIFIGMHRSGTSLLVRLLEQMGLFVGHKKDYNNEAVFFRDINKWLLSISAARWDNPYPIDYLWSCEEVLELIEDYLHFLISSPRLVKFLGLRRYFSYRSIFQLDILWGWKDPRNTFTLPLWLRLFPNAKVIYIKRHGVDVAQSLRLRGHKGFGQNRQRYHKFKSTTWIRTKRDGFMESHRCASLEGGFSLWMEYQRRASELISALNTEQVFRLRYEDLLAKPIPEITRAAQFCGLSVDRDLTEKVCSYINVSRAHAYSGNTELLNFAKINSSQLYEFGY
jgi:hypothetical protein